MKRRHFLGALAASSTAAVVSAVWPLPPMAFAQAGGAPPLARVLASFAFDSLRGGGQRSDAVWELADSVSADLLAPAAPPIGWRPAASTLPLCPGSTEATGAPTPRPVGYRVAVARDSSAAHGPILTLTVRCVFRYRGRPRGFAEGATWQLDSGPTGLVLGRLIDRFIT